jgi:hemoglobin-like flavoprotein
MGMAILRQIEVQLIKVSFNRVFAQKAALAEKFYHHLFLELPDVEAMFTRDFSHQTEMFARVLTTGMQSLGRDRDMMVLVDDLLQRHKHLALTLDQMYTAQRALHLAFCEVMQAELTAAEVSAWDNAIGRLCRALAAGIEPPAA